MRTPRPLLPQLRAAKAERATGLSRRFLNLERAAHHVSATQALTPLVKLAPMAPGFSEGILLCTVQTLDGGFNPDGIAGFDGRAWFKMTGVLPIWTNPTMLSSADSWQAFLKQTDDYYFDSTFILHQGNSGATPWVDVAPPHRYPYGLSVTTDGGLWSVTSDVEPIVSFKPLGGAWSDKYTIPTDQHGYGGDLAFPALTASRDGQRVLRGERSMVVADTADAAALGDALGNDLLARGAAAILAEVL